ncbi:hypothetical protein EBB07_25275 [Paenibacillaceae bacterium]|nr:hypothetical protein EBB07_25275 [Paenibacillaceae bacterium]
MIKMPSSANMDELVQHYFDNPDYVLDSVPFGLTNFTRILTVNDEKLVLRIYNPHTKHHAGIELESAVISFFAKQPCSFHVPLFRPTLEGRDYVELSDGSLGAIVSFLEGHVPELSDIKAARQFGQVVGEFSSVIGHYDPKSLTNRGTSFADYYQLHPLADRQAVHTFIEHPPIAVPAALLQFYKDMVSEAESSLFRIKTLPTQLVHHDLLIFNLLAEGGKITGVLDFDFISMDIAFMEFAISFNHVLQESNGSLEMAEAFVAGYSSIRNHAPDETAMLPLLTQIYHLAVLHIYIGQYYAGAKIEQHFNYFLHQFANRMSWLNDHKSDTQSLLGTLI